jgi:CheY-like chemotaxis protein
VATTLLAIDDSVTMRKVLEMTFAGEDYRVVTADSGDAGLAKLRTERPAVVLCDVTLDGPGGYALCAKIKAENPTVSVVLLASKQQPYDAQKGQGARADDYIEKPFDTQQLIEKVKRLVGRPVGEVAPPPVARPAGAGATTQPGVPAFGAPVSTRTGTAPPGGPPMPPARPAAPAGMPLNPRPTAPGMGAGGGPSPQPVGRGTLSYGGLPGSTPSTGPTGPPSGPRAPMPPAAPPPAPAPQISASMPASTASHTAVTHPAPPHSTASSHGPTPASVAGAAVASATNGQLAAKLAHLGLTDAQVSAVLALSRDVVEKVVWEVVPVLAETMIREEIKRLTSE